MPSSKRVVVMEGGGSERLQGEKEEEGVKGREKFVFTQNGEGGVGQTVAAPMASWGEEAARLARGRVPCGLHQL